MRKAITALACAGAVALTTSAADANPSYYPRVAGRPAGTAEGVLINLGVGSGSGTVTIRQGGNAKRYFYVAINMLLEGKPLRCVIAPTPHHPRSPETCEYWPPTVTIGSTRVRVTYWRGTRWGRRTEIAGKVDSIR